MAKFRVALSADFLNSEGAFAYPMVELDRLLNAPDVECAYVRSSDGIMPAEALEGFDALLLHGPRFTKNSVPNSRRLAVIARFGVGLDSVDLHSCTEAGIAVVTTPDAVRRPVATAILTLILAVSGKLLEKDRIARLGPPGFHLRQQVMGTGLTGKTLGSVGLGNIACEMFRLATPFEMNHVAYSPSANQALADECDVRLVELDDIFRLSDIVTVNCPLTPDTRHLVNERRLGLMKRDAILINTSRGGVVDQRALTTALQQGQIAGAGLDVTEREPIDVEDPILALDNVVLTPHSLCWTDECFARIGAIDIDAVLAVKNGEVPRGLVNKAVLTNPLWSERRRHQAA
jgi:D-3-phosphoglycerate dehydrogenase